MEAGVCTVSRGWELKINKNKEGMMMRLKLILSTVTIMLFVCLTPAASTETYYVCPETGDDSAAGTEFEPLLTISQAVGRSTDEDVIILMPGIYSGLDNMNIDPSGKAITIRGSDPDCPESVSETVMDGSAEEGRAFIFDSGEGPDTVIEGITIRNFTGFAGQDGGAIFTTNNSSPLFRNCIIKNNSSQRWGGVIWVGQQSHPAFINCLIIGNNASDGGVAEIDAGIATFRNCRILSNNADLYAGFLNCFRGTANIKNCTVIGNSAEKGGAVSLTHGGGVHIKNSIFRANLANNGNNIFIEKGLADPSESVIGYSNIEGLKQSVYIDPAFEEPDAIIVWKGDNLNEEPLFVHFDLSDDPADWDVHLQSEYGRWCTDSQDWVVDPNTSPCIAAGDPNSSWEDEPWPNWKRINMGAYGGTAFASKYGNIADFNLDYSVDYADLAEITGMWMEQNEPQIYDISGSGKVEFSDLAIFAENWLWQKD